MRRFLIAAAAVVVAGIAAAFLLRQSLIQGELRPAVEARLSATLGAPVSIGRLGVSVFPRVVVSGGDVRVGDAGTQAPSVAIERIRILPRVRPLLSGDVVVEQVYLDGFIVSVLRDEAGRWHLPPAVPSPTAGDGAGIVIEHVRVAGARVRIFDALPGGQIRERSSIDDLRADVTVDNGGLRLSSLNGRIAGSAVAGEAWIDAKEARLEFAAESIADEDLPAFLHLLGSERPDSLRLEKPASLSAAIRVNRATSRLSGTGTLRAPEVVLDPLRLHQFAAPFVIEGSRVVFDPAAFQLYGGTHNGSIDFDTAAKPPAWTIDSRVTGLDAGAFLNALNGSDQRLDGRASLTGVLHGRLGAPLAQTVRGRAHVEVANGVIRNFPLLAAVARALRLAEQHGSDTHFSRLSATLAVGSGGATTDDLVLQASDLHVHAAGRIGADRSLALRGIAAVSPERSSAAIASIHELSGLRNARGEVEVPLTISGTLDAPSFDIDIQSMIKKGILDELRRRLRRIIR